MGGIISHTSSKFKFKNLAQTVITMAMLLVVFYFSANLEGMISKLAENAVNINDAITKIYYPAGAYVKLVTNFNVLDILVFILIHIILFAVSILIFSNIYFKINSKTKVVKKGTRISEYKIKSNRPIIALIKTKNT